MTDPIHFRCQLPTKFEPITYLLCKQEEPKDRRRWYLSGDWRFVTCEQCKKMKGREINYRLPEDVTGEEAFDAVAKYALGSDK